MEGCNKEGNPEDDERSRRLFKGTVEVNGLLVEPASGDAPLIATTTSGSTSLGLSALDGHLDRSQAVRLVLDPRIGGERRRIVIHNGPLHLDGDSEVPNRPGDDYIELLGGEREMISWHATSARRPWRAAACSRMARRCRRRGASTSAAGSAPPASPSAAQPALLGLRLFDLDDVLLGNDGMAFDAELKLGSAAPG